MKFQYYIKARWLCTYPKKSCKIFKFLQQELKNKHCVIGKKIPLLSSMPLFLSKREFNRLKHASEAISNIIEKTISTLFTSTRFRQYINTNIIPKEWLDVPQIYDRCILINRLDCLFDGNNLQFIGCNTDNPGPYTWPYITRKIIATHPFYKKLVKFPKQETKPAILSELLKTVKNIHLKMNKAEKPIVVFLDYANSKSADTNLSVKFFSKNGIESFKADLSQFKFKNNKVYVQGKQVDIVICKMKIQDIIKQQVNGESFIKGYLKQSFHFFNHPSALHGEEKNIFSLITNPEFQSIYNKKELEIIKFHIPWTRMLSEVKTSCPNQNITDLKEFVINNKNQLILKPVYKSNLKKILLGIKLSQEEWEKTINLHFGNKDWVVQQYIPLRTIPIPTLNNKKVTVQHKHFYLSNFVINGNFAGVLARFSDNPIIKSEDGILPVLHY